MNMHRASRLGWIRSLTGASSHAPAKAADTAQADMAAATGRAPAAAGSRSSRSRGPAARARTLRAATGHRAKRSGLLLLATAALLLIPALAYADVPVATISGPFPWLKEPAALPTTRYTP